MVAEYGKTVRQRIDGAVRYLADSLVLDRARLHAVEGFPEVLLSRVTSQHGDVHDHRVQRLAVVAIRLLDPKVGHHGRLRGGGEIVGADAILLVHLHRREAKKRHRGADEDRLDRIAGLLVEAAVGVVVVLVEPDGLEEAVEAPKYCDQDDHKRKRAQQVSIRPVSLTHGVSSTLLAKACESGTLQVLCSSQKYMGTSTRSVPIHRVVRKLL